MVPGKNQFRRSDIKMGIFTRFLSVDKRDITMRFEVKDVLGIEPEEYQKNEFDGNDMNLFNGGI